MLDEAGVVEVSGPSGEDVAVGLQQAGHPTTVILQQAGTALGVQDLQVVGNRNRVRINRLELQSHNFRRLKGPSHGPFL